MTSPALPTEGAKYHYYKRFFRFSDRDLHGYLTYTLEAGTLDHRNAILIDHHLDPVPPSLRGPYSAYASALARVRASGVVGAAKRFLTQRDSLPQDVAKHIAVAAHKFGPVPTFDLQTSIPVLLHDTIVDARLLCYVNPSKPSERDQAVSDLPAFLSSLEIAPQRLFYRYFEDVASRLNDILLHGNLRSTAMWLKEIETSVAQSLTSKLRWIKPSSLPAQYGSFEWRKWRREPELPNDEELRRQFFIRNHLVVCFANHMRSALLYLVNCVYRSLGMNSRRGEYLERMATEQEHFRQFFDYDVLDEARRTYPDLDEFCEYLTALQQGDEQLLYQDCRGTRWLQEIVSFMRHLYWTGSVTPDPMRPVFFVSHHHYDRKSETQATLASEFIQTSLGANSLLIHRDGNDTRFRESIKAAIWRCDRLVSVTVAEPKDSRSGTMKAFDWLSSESEYATLQGKKVIFALEDGPELEFYKKAVIDTPFPLLAQSPRRPETARRLRLLKEWHENNHLRFSPKGKVLDSRFRSRLEHEGTEALTRRRKVILASYLSLFDLGRIRMLSLVYAELGATAGVTRARIVQLFQKALADQGDGSDSVFGSLDDAGATTDSFLAYFRENRRSLNIGSDAYYALRIVPATSTKRRFSYRSQLSELIAVLFPELDYRAKREVLRSCIQEAMDLQQVPD